MVLYIEIVGKTELHFVGPGVKIPSEYYSICINSILNKFLARNVRKLFPNGRYVFHQGSAPSHTSKKILKFMNQHMKFIQPEEWVSKSPDAAPMDYFVLGYLKQKLWKKKANDMAALKCALKTAEGIAARFDKQTLRSVYLFTAKTAL